MEDVHHQFYLYTWDSDRRLTMVRVSPSPQSWETATLAQYCYDSNPFVPGYST